MLSTNEISQLYGMPCLPHRARATTILDGERVIGAAITDPGCGYTNNPTVLIQGGGGSGAVAEAVVNNGFVVAINIVDSGCCYTNAPRIAIASPPFVPTLNISVSRVKVTQNVVLGKNYVLESSSNLIDWTSTGQPFTAMDETITNEFEIGVTGSFFRIRQIP